MTRKGGVSVGLLGLSLAGLIAAPQSRAQIQAPAQIQGQAQAQVTYPAALDAATLDAWLQQSTDLRPDQVVAVSPSALFAVVSLGETRAQPREVTLRAEALTPDAVARSGVLAWEMRLQANCRTGQIHVGETRGYSARTPDGHPVPLAPAEPDWRRPKDGTALASVLRQVCQAGTRPPAVQKASRPPPTSTSAPLPALLRPTLGPPGRGAAQVVSSPQEGDARSTLTRLRSRFSAAFAQLDTRIEPAQVGGRTVYRGLVVGFASRDDAAAFCETLKRRGQDCLAR